ncbi:NADH dehydrogenase [ubiquinone] 1 alpha subcomplex subunit 13 [Eufriesea mexicana]|uniref:NADH dehydrogenase [ubiquinone] 1 alpha subcomplex subunit 13 n=1 Tax=Eufriesea mexicana TaxID=516756 RepID=A0A310SQW4_9HYME|nr:PREDICTED: NADH dehydrogenase [ubiquinone] 1 alpha subcomplex subunit 13 [Eufriesea mexicana]OAD57413.1 NADH dehydrogenase [ubiquinone] 1 alpha subcomplex subunit 13 [Eufriesea mexicana]
MTSNSKHGPQDLPPKNGYPPLDFSRIRVNTFMKGKWALALFIATNVVGMPLYFEGQKILTKRKIAKLSDELAIFPIFLAEMDRNILRYMKKARDIETDVMKNFPKWEVGTYFGSKRYQTLSEDTYVTPPTADFYLFTQDLMPSRMIFAR